MHRMIRDNRHLEMGSHMNQLYSQRWLGRTRYSLMSVSMLESTYASGRHSRDQGLIKDSRRSTETITLPTILRIPLNIPSRKKISVQVPLQRSLITLTWQWRNMAICISMISDSSTCQTRLTVLNHSTQGITTCSYLRIYMSMAVTSKNWKKRLKNNHRSRSTQPMISHLWSRKSLLRSWTYSHANSCLTIIDIWLHNHKVSWIRSMVLSRLKWTTTL